MAFKAWMPGTRPGMTLKFRITHLLIPAARMMYDPRRPKERCESLEPWPLNPPGPLRLPPNSAASC